MRPSTVLYPRAIVPCLLSVLLGIGCAARYTRPAPTGVPVRIAWLIFVDDLHMDFRNTGLIRDLFRTISTKLIRDEDVFAMRSDGPSSIAIGPSSDLAIFEAAIPTIAGHGLQALDISHASKNETDEIELRLTVTFSAALNLLAVVPASADGRRARSSRSVAR